jgi:hypothetical protein
MRTLDSSLVERFAAGKISERNALAISTNPEILKGRLNAIGR